MEEELIKNQERLKPQEEKQEEERSRVDDLRGSPMSVGTLEEIIDDNHAIVSTSVGSEHYVSILSFVDKDQLEPGDYYPLLIDFGLPDSSQYQTHLHVKPARPMLLS